MRLGTRRSALALAQAQLAAALLGDCELVPISTSGDRDAPAEDKSRWVDALERALLAGEIDLAVHSAKDVPGELASDLVLLGTLARGPVEDALCGAPGLRELRPGARVGTSSVRRVAQLRAEREDLELVALRGNVDTRLRKLAAGEQALEAIVLARAGLERLGRASEIGALLDAARFVPAPGQGTLAFEGRAGDEDAQRAVERAGDAATFACLRAERALARALQADCHTPLGAHCEPLGGGALRLRGWFGADDGSAWVRDELVGAAGAPEALGREVGERMSAAGAGALARGDAEPAGRDGR
jgi:hydroxymethylbilane synthase